jgi:hypothetical protein
MITWSLIWGVGKWVAVGVAAGLLYLKITSDAFDRGFAKRDTEAREQIQRMEERLAKRMRENEGLDDDAIDCALKRLRNPKAECGK